MNHPLQIVPKPYLGNPSCEWLSLSERDLWIASFGVPSFDGDMNRQPLEGNPRLTWARCFFGSGQPTSWWLTAPRRNGYRFWFGRFRSEPKGSPAISGFRFLQNAVLGFTGGCGIIVQSSLNFVVLGAHPGTWNLVFRGPLMQVRSGRVALL